MIQVAIILVILLGAGGFGGYTWIQKLQADNKVLEVNHAKLEGAVTEQNAVIESLSRQAEAIQKANNELRDRTNQLTTEKNNLAGKLGKHELDILAQNKPVLVQRVINRASDRVMRCFEILTGSPLTEQEKNASKPSQFNSECPSIHPKYTGEGK